MATGFHSGCACRGGEERGPAAAADESSYELGRDTVRPPLSCVPGHPTYPELLLLGAGEWDWRGCCGGGVTVTVVAVLALFCVLPPPPLTTARELNSEASRAMRVLLLLLLLFPLPAVALLAAGGGVSTVDLVFRAACAFFQRRARCAKAELFWVAWLTTDRCSSFFSSCNRDWLSR